MSDETADRLAIQLLQASAKAPHIAAFISELGLIMGADRDSASALRLLEYVSSPKAPSQSLSIALSSLGEGLSRRGSSMQALRKSKQFTPKLEQAISQAFQRAADLAGNQDAALMDRVEAIGMLAFADAALIQSELPELLTPRSPQALQSKMRYEVSYVFLII